MDDYPLLGMFFTILWFFLFVAWISVVIGVLSDIFRSADISGAGKAGWTLLVVVLPLLGVLLYLISRGNSMQERDIQEAARREQALQAYIRDVAGTPAPTATTRPPTP
ncbi:SHOCT domain-containing protein [Nocardioides sp. LHG3406-4]|uniref:SHOCT domain-containing protein n=1 Tax=Nocardioides sp. LHG3406-4 TaxID=2804575 RepID=UPI003CF79547